MNLVEKGYQRPTGRNPIKSGGRVIRKPILGNENGVVGDNGQIDIIKRPDLGNRLRIRPIEPQPYLLPPNPLISNSQWFKKIPKSILKYKNGSGVKIPRKPGSVKLL
jgi:hypothetical protein